MGKIISQRQFFLSFFSFVPFFYYIYISGFFFFPFLVRLLLNQDTWVPVIPQVWWWLPHRLGFSLHSSTHWGVCCYLLLIAALLDLIGGVRPLNKQGKTLPLLGSVHRGGFGVPRHTLPGLYQLCIPGSHGGATGAADPSSLHLGVVCFLLKSSFCRGCLRLK